MQGDCIEVLFLDGMACYEYRCCYDGRWHMSHEGYGNHLSALEGGIRQYRKMERDWVGMIRKQNAKEEI